MRFKKSIQDVQSPERVEQIIQKVRAQAVELGIDPDLVEQLYRAMIQQFSSLFNVN